ncbi:MAG: SDR family oxidoreductase [Halanaerobiales bacterium]|nr:SDR family oxidoreductase [Halanaerobiales bacterium]
MEFEGKLVLITAGLDGFDKAAAIKFAEQGADIAIIYSNNEHTVQKICTEVKKYGIKVLATQSDLTDLSEMERAIAEVVDYFGKIDICVNTSMSLSSNKFFMDEKDANWKKKIVDNLTVTFNCCKTVGLQMIKQSYGKIINLYTFDRLSHHLGQTFSWTVKESISSMTKNIAKELAYKGITVNTIESGLLESHLKGEEQGDLYQKAVKMIPVGYVGKVDDVISGVLFLASEKASYITGQVIVVDGGLEAKSKVRCL